MYKFNYIIQKSFSDMKIFDFLTYFHLGNEKIKILKKTGYILINEEAASINSIIKENDKLILCLDEDIEVKPYKAHLDIIYEDDYLLIINKEAGLAIHSDGAKYIDNTMQNMVAYYYKKKGYNLPVWYLHRLDFDTTGLIIFCKDPLSMAKLSYELSTHDLKRDYLALVSGIYPNDELINLKIGRNRHVNGKYIVSPTGKEAITTVNVVEKFKRYTLVRLSLKTGRTHQIRVHMSYKGHPLLGDTLYGGGTRYIERQALHSAYLEFEHPIYNKHLSLAAPLPKDMEKLVKK